MKLKKLKDDLKEIVFKIEDALKYELDELETVYYEETLNQYGSKHETKKQIMKYVNELKERLEKED